MSKLSNSTIADIRQIGQDLSVSAFKIRTILGVQDDELNQDRLNDAWKEVEKAIEILAYVINSEETKPDAEPEARH